MPYYIEVRREIYTIISRIHSDDLSVEDIQRYIDEIIVIGEAFIAEGLPNLYHIVIAEDNKFDFGGIFKSLSALRQNKSMIAVRTQLNMMTILVGAGMQNLQFTQHMMSSPQYGGRPIAMLPSLEVALESVLLDIAAQGPSPSVDSMN